MHTLAVACPRYHLTAVVHFRFLAGHSLHCAGYQLRLTSLAACASLAVLDFPWLCLPPLASIFAGPPLAMGFQYLISLPR